jgi:hypothetical protein
MVDWSTSLAAQSAKAWKEDLEKRSAEKAIIDREQNRRAGESITAQLQGKPGLFPSGQGLSSPSGLSQDEIKAGFSGDVTPTGSTPPPLRQDESLLGGKRIGGTGVPAPEVPIPKWTEGDSKVAGDTKKFIADAKNTVSPDTAKSADELTKKAQSMPDFTPKSEGWESKYGMFSKTSKDAEGNTKIVGQGIGNTGGDLNSKIDALVDSLMNDPKNIGTQAMGGGVIKTGGLKDNVLNSIVELRKAQLGLKGHEVAAEASLDANRANREFTQAYRAENMAQRKDIADENRRVRMDSEFDNLMKTYGEDNMDKGLFILSQRSGYIPEKYRDRANAMNKDYTIKWNAYAQDMAKQGKAPNREFFEQDYMMRTFK